MRSLSRLDDALLAIDDAAAAQCDAVKLGSPSQGSLPIEWCTALFARAELRGIALLARPLDEIEVTRLDWVGASAFDLSFDLCDLELIATAARTGKPIFLSTGRATYDELAEIVTLAKRRHNDNLALIAPVHEHDDLDVIDRLAALGVPVGIADSHSDPALALAGIARGASIVEKRRGDRALMAHTIRGCEIAWSSLGHAAPQYVTN